MRPDHSADRKLIEKRLPATSPPRQVSRLGIRKNLRFRDKQCRNPGENDSRFISLSMTGRTFFQMDLATPAN